MKKKLTTTAMALTMALSLAACGGGNLTYYAYTGMGITADDVR